MLFWQRENIVRLPLRDERPSSAAGRGGLAVAGRAVPLEDKSKDAENEFREEIENLIYHKKYPIYSENSKAATDTIRGLMTQYRALNGRGQSQRTFVAEAKHILTERGRAIKRQSNVLRQEVEVRNSQKDAGKLDFNTLGPEMMGRMGIEPKRWPAYFDEYGPQYDDFSGFQDKVEDIKNNVAPTLHTMPLRRHGLPGVPSYRRLLHEANKQTKEALEKNEYELNSLITTGELPLPKSNKAIREALHGTGSAASGLAVSGFNAFRTLVNAAGKGIWSKSDPNYSSYLRKYHDKRNQLLSNLVWKLDPKQNKNSRLMQRCKEILERSQNEDGLMDANSFRELTQLITEEVSKSDAASTHQMKNFNETINKLNEQALDTAKDQTTAADAMFKWRVLQLALIITPFMGLSVMGPVLNLFSGVFMNAGGLGHGIASLATGQYTGPFGDLCELLHLDDAIRWLLCDMPITSDVVTILDSVVSSHLVQGVLGGVVLPLAGSPLVPIAIAGVYSLFRVNAEIEHSKKYGDAFKGHEKAMRAELEKIAKEAAETPGEYDEKTGKFKPWNIKGFVDKKFDIMRNFYLKSSLAEYAIDKFRELKELGGSEKFFVEIMGQDFMTALQAYKSDEEITAPDGTVKIKTSKVFDEQGNINDKVLMNFLADGKRDSGFYDTIRYFRAIERKSEEEAGHKIELTQTIKKFQEAPEFGGLRQGVIDAEKKKQEEEYIMELADKCGVDNSDVPQVYRPRIFAEHTPENRQARIDEMQKVEESKQKRAAELAKVEEKIKQEEVKFFEHTPNLDSDIKQNFTPMPSTMPKSSLPFAPQLGQAITVGSH